MRAPLLLNSTDRENERERRLPLQLRKLVDEQRRYEIIPNGHSSFLTRAAQRRLLEGIVNDMDRCMLEPLSEARLLRARKESASRIPEPKEDYGPGRSIVTLRLRALPGRRIPDLSEGDFISGTLPSYHHGVGGGRRQNFQSVKEFVEKSGYREFRVLDIHWGTKTLVNLLTEGSAARKVARSTSDTNAFVVCEAVL